MAPTERLQGHARTQRCRQPTYVAADLLAFLAALTDDALLVDPAFACSWRA